MQILLAYLLARCFLECMKLPKVIYVRSEKDRDGQYFVAESSAKGHGGKAGETRTAGVYRLEKTIIVTTEITTTEK